MNWRGFRPGFPGGRFLRRLWPDSLCGQLLAAMLLGAAVLQGLNLFAVCYIQHSYNKETHKVRYDYDSSLYLALSHMDPAGREAFLADLARSQSGLSQPSRFRVSGEPAWSHQPSFYVDEAMLALGRALAAASPAEIPAVRARVLTASDEAAPGSDQAGERNPLLHLAVQMADGNWLEVVQPLEITNRTAVWMQRLFILLESVLFSLLVVWLITRVTRPLFRLGQAAEQFGRNPESARPLPESGSREVREAAQSFNRMRDRIRDNLNERNRMLEAMGHDLRTPLAKIQLRLDKVRPEPLKDQLAANLQEVQSIIEQGLELAGSLRTSEEAVPLDIAAFAQSIVDDLAGQGLNVSLTGFPQDEDDPLLVLARPTCLKRCLENLLTNAVKYAGGARMSVARQGERLIIEVNDNGPGIPEHLLEKVFEPYYRLERSRNRDSGGIGLGLSIARNMVLLNNGSLFLRNRPEGGLTARVLLSRPAVLGC